jgi:hypothetical protein
VLHLGVVAGGGRIDRGWRAALQPPKRAACDRLGLLLAKGLRRVEGFVDDKCLFRINRLVPDVRREARERGVAATIGGVTFGDQAVELGQLVERPAVLRNSPETSCELRSSAAALANCGPTARWSSSQYSFNAILNFVWYVMISTPIPPKVSAMLFIGAPIRAVWPLHQADAAAARIPRPEDTARAECRATASAPVPMLRPVPHLLPATVGSTADHFRESLAPHRSAPERRGARLRRS